MKKRESERERKRACGCIIFECRVFENIELCIEGNKNTYLLRALLSTETRTARTRRTANSRG